MNESLNGFQNRDVTEPQRDGGLPSGKTERAFLASLRPLTAYGGALPEGEPCGIIRLNNRKQSLI